MPTRPWYRWNPSDYLADAMHLSLEADGLYRRLLDRYWMDGFLPSCDRTLARLCREDIRKFRRCFKELSQFFAEENGKLINKRMEQELNEFSKKSVKASASASARWTRTDAIALQPQGTRACDRNANQNQNQNNTTTCRTTTEFDEQLARELARHVATKLQPRTDQNRECCWRAGYVVATGRVHRGALDGSLIAIDCERPQNPFRFLFGCMRSRADLPDKGFENLWNNSPPAPPPVRSA